MSGSEKFNVFFSLEWKKNYKGLSKNSSAFIVLFKFNKHFAITVGWLHNEGIIWEEKRTTHK